MEESLRELQKSIKHSISRFYPTRVIKPPRLDEVFLCKELSRAIGGKTEVRTPVGRIDLLRYDLILETKKTKEWKGAIGQLFCYELYHKRRHRGIGIIGTMPRYCPAVCEELGLLLLHYDFNTYKWAVY